MQPPDPAVRARSAANIGRSIRLFRAFLVEQSDPDRFYSALAEDSVSQAGAWCRLSGARVLDVGGGPGYFAAAFERAGSRYVGVEPDAGELTARGPATGTAVRASGLALPFPSGAFDLTFSSNVLEHVSTPEEMAQEMVRVTAPGGTVVLSWTPWLSPWGGHETAPWHYLLGGRGAAERYARRHGHRPKNDYGISLFACSVARMARWLEEARAHGQVRVVRVLPRYHPWWAQWVIRVPGLREVVSWNAMIVLTKVA